MGLTGKGFCKRNGGAAFRAAAHKLHKQMQQEGSWRHDCMTCPNFLNSRQASSTPSPPASHLGALGLRGDGGTSRQSPSLALSILCIRLSPPLYKNPLRPSSFMLSPAVGCGLHPMPAAMPRHQRVAPLPLCAAGPSPCDKRRPLSESRAAFPGVDFSLIEHEEDVMWETQHVESESAVVARGMKFLQARREAGGGC
jgi:hypothetical protein